MPSVLVVHLGQVGYEAQSWFLNWTCARIKTGELGVQPIRFSELAHKHPLPLITGLGFLGSALRWNRRLSSAQEGQGPVGRLLACTPLHWILWCL